MSSIGKNMTNLSYNIICARLVSLGFDIDSVDKVCCVLRDVLSFDPNGVGRDRREEYRKSSSRRREVCKASGMTTYEKWGRSYYENKKKKNAAKVI